MKSAPIAVLACASMLLWSAVVTRGQAAGPAGASGGNRMSEPNKPSIHSAGSRAALDKNATLDKAKQHKPEDINRLLEEFKAAQKQFLDEEKKLQKQWREAPVSQRDAIRTQLRDKRDAFLEQQREMREEIRKRIDELKGQLKEHGDIIDDAKEQARDRAKQRKGGEN